MCPTDFAPRVDQPMHSIQRNVVQAIAAQGTEDVVIDLRMGHIHTHIIESEGEPWRGAAGPRHRQDVDAGVRAYYHTAESANHSLSADRHLRAVGCFQPDVDRLLHERLQSGSVPDHHHIRTGVHHHVLRAGFQRTLGHVHPGDLLEHHPVPPLHSATKKGARQVAHHHAVRSLRVLPGHLPVSLHLAFDRECCVHDRAVREGDRLDLITLHVQHATAHRKQPHHSLRACRRCRGARRRSHHRASGETSSPSRRRCRNLMFRSAHSLRDLLTIPGQLLQPLGLLVRRHELLQPRLRGISLLLRSLLRQSRLLDLCFRSRRLFLTIRSLAHHLCQVRRATGLILLDRLILAR